MGVYMKATGIYLGGYMGQIDFLWRKITPEELMAFLVDIKPLIKPPEPVATKVKELMVANLPTTCADAARRALLGASNGQKESSFYVAREDGQMCWVSSQQAIVLSECSEGAKVSSMARLNQCRALRQVLEQLEAEIS